MWAIQSNFIYHQNVVEIVAALNKLKIPYVTLGIMPFSRELKLDRDNDEDVAGLGLDILPYGSTTLLKIAMERGWKRLSFNDNFDFRCWQGARRRDMLNRDGFVCTVAEAAAHAAKRDPNEMFFIRPVGDLKLFSGTVAPASEIARWMQSAESGHFTFTNDDLVVLAPPKKILAEWRYFICNEQIVSGSQYRSRGQLCVKRETDPNVLKEAQMFADVWLPHRNCVMDLALDGDGVVQVIEFNCINGSGFYDHDIERIVVALEKAS